MPSIRDGISFDTESMSTWVSEIHQKDRTYSSKRRALAADLGMDDSTLKGFLPADDPTASKKSGTLGLDKVARLLGKPEFQDLRNHFPELAAAIPLETPIEFRLDIDFEGFGGTLQNRKVRLPVGKEGKLHVTITKTA